MKESEWYEKLGMVRSNVRSEVGKALVADETWSSVTFLPSTCQAVTKTGVACSAKPVKTSQLCVGHLRQAEAEA